MFSNLNPFVESVIISLIAYVTIILDSSASSLRDVREFDRTMMARAN